jgi:hypothetical protein
VQAAAALHKAGDALSAAAGYTLLLETAERGRRTHRDLIGASCRAPRSHCHLQRPL